MTYLCWHSLSGMSISVMRVTQALCTSAGMTYQLKKSTSGVVMDPVTVSSCGVTRVHSWIPGISKVCCSKLLFFWKAVFFGRMVLSIGCFPNGEVLPTVRSWHSVCSCQGTFLRLLCAFFTFYSTANEMEAQCPVLHHSYQF